MTSFAAPDPTPWTPIDFAAALVMWSVMMAAMMLPSVYPWVRALTRKADTTRSWPGFLSGYFTAWTVFSFAAASIQWGLSTLAPGGADSRRLAGAGLLVIAGVYQWTPWKERCLSHCRSPLGYFLTKWKNGRARFFRMGFSHGLFCVGCCWALMLLSFVAGIMNFWWMALMTLFVFVDHTSTAGLWMGRVAGLILVVWAGWLVRLTG